MCVHEWEVAESQPTRHKKLFSPQNLLSLTLLLAQLWPTRSEEAKEWAHFTHLLLVDINLKTGFMVNSPQKMEA